MEIIKHAMSDTPRRFLVKCRCGTHFTCVEGEGVRVHDYRLAGLVDGEACTGTALKVKCPVCSHENSKSLG